MSNALRRDIFDHGKRARFRRKDRQPGAAEDAHADDLCGHQGRQSRSADAVEGRESLAALHGHGQLHGPQRRRGPLPRRNRSHAAESHPLHGAGQPVRCAAAIPRGSAATLPADPPAGAHPQSLPARRQSRQGSRPARSSTPSPALRSHRHHARPHADSSPTWPARWLPGA